MIITTRIKTDFVLRGPAEHVSVMQDDKYSRNLEIAMFAGGAAFSPGGDVSALVRYVKPDGTGGEYDALPDGTAACSLSGNVLTVALAPQVLTAAGRVRLSAALIDGTAELNTFSVYIDVQPNPKLQTTSEDYYKVTGALASSGWTPNMYLGTDANGNVVTREAPEGGSGGGATVDEILEALPQVTALDFSNFENGTWTETVDGEVISHTVTFDDSGRPVTIDDIAITWEVTA